MAENFFGLTDTGRVRGNNEDAFIAQHAWNDKFIIACVIDGVGGYSGGEVAADIAREAILEHTAKATTDIIAMMKRAFQDANEKIHSERLRVKEHDSMACVLTLAAIDIENNVFYYAHIGDTRLYLFRDNSLVKITKDHSFVGFMEESGRISEDSAMRHPKRNEINKALGFGGDLDEDDYIETGQSPFLPGDMLLLCSDGLTDMVNKQTMTDVLTKKSQLEEKATELISEANAKGGKDNITVVLVQNTKSPTKHEATMPTPVKKKAVDNPVKVVDTEPDTVIVNPEPPHRRRGGGVLTTILSLVCLGLLATTLYLLWLRGKEVNKTKETASVAPTIDKPRSPGELKLQNAIDTFIGDTLYLSDSVFTDPILISDTIQIVKDTIYIKTRGNIVLQRDSAYKGPAIKLTSECKSVMIDSLELRDFDLGISTMNTALQLNNVRFTNCRVPVRATFNFPANKFISGRIADNAFATDSLPRTQVAPARTTRFYKNRR